MWELPRSKLTEEAAKYAIQKEEYLGVLGKEYTAKEQENRLKIDLTRLKDNAASVTNPSLDQFLQAIVNVACDKALCIHCNVVSSVLIVVTRGCE